MDISDLTSIDDIFYMCNTFVSHLNVRYKKHAPVVTLTLALRRWEVGNHG